MPTDSVDRSIAAWADRDPRVDTSVLEVVARLRLCTAHLERALSSALRPLGVSLGEFDVLVTLRRHATDGLKPTELAQSALITTGAMTTRLHRLEQTGHVRRVPDPRDGRGLLIQLTEQGASVADRALAAALEADEAFVEPLNRRQRDAVASGLRLLLLRSEPV